MKKLIIFILLLVILLEGFIYFRGRATVESIARSQFRTETGLNIDFENWRRTGYVIEVYRPKITSDSKEEGSVTADFLRLDLDPSKILSRHLTIKEILVDGLSIDSPSDQSAFFKLIEWVIKVDPDPLIKSNVVFLKGKNFKKSKFKVGVTSIDLIPSRIEINLSEIKKPLIQAESPFEITLELPKALTNLSSVVGDITVSGELLAPEIVSNLKFKNSDLIQLAASLYQGVFTVRPMIQADTQGGQKAIASGELQLKNFKLAANDFTIKGLPFGLINPALNNAENEILANGELNLLNFTGDLWGALRILNIESLPVALKDLRLELAISNKEVVIKEGSFKGDAGAIELTGGYNLVSKKLSGAIKTQKLLIKVPDIKARIPRGIQLSSEINVSGDLIKPEIKGAAELNLFKLGLNGEEISEALIPSQLELTLNRQRLSDSQGIWRIEPLTIEAQGREIKTTAVIPIKIENGIITLPQTEVIIGDRKIKIHGDLSREGYDFSALGNADVLSLIGRKDNIEDIAGEIAVKLNIQGTIGNPQISGEINLIDGGFSVPLSGDRFHLEDIDGKITFDDRDLRLEQFQNTAGDARVTMNGGIQNFLSPQRSGVITAKFEQATIQPDPNMVVHLHADTELRLTPDSPPALKGDIVIEDAIYEQRSNLQELIKKMLGILVKGSQTASSRQLTSPILADITVKADRNMVVDTDIFQGELSSNLAISADTKRITINGSIFGDSGELTLGHNKFDVSLIKVSFEDQELGSLPKFDLRADGELGPRGSTEQVQLRVSGMLPSPGIRLSSESARSQKELLAELGLGIDKLSVFSNQSRSTPSLIGALNPFSGAGLTDRVGDLTGGASVQVESGYSADTGTFAPKLLLEQPLPYTFRLVGRSELSQFNRNEINLEYPLTDQTNVFTGWKNAPSTKNPENLTGSFGVGIHYRERFPGTYVLPTKLLLENLEEIFGSSEDESIFDEETHP